MAETSGKATSFVCMGRPKPTTFRPSGVVRTSLPTSLMPLQEQHPCQNDTRCCFATFETMQLGNSIFWAVHECQLFFCDLELGGFLWAKVCRRIHPWEGGPLFGENCAFELLVSSSLGKVPSLLGPSHSVRQQRPCQTNRRLCCSLKVMAAGQHPGAVCLPPTTTNNKLPRLSFPFPFLLVEKA